MAADRISFAMNTRLPADIRIQESAEVPMEFHPRFANTVKTYEYRIFNRKFPDPTKRLYSFFYHYIYLYAYANNFLFYLSFALPHELL